MSLQCGFSWECSKLVSFFFLLHYLRVFGGVTPNTLSNLGLFPGLVYYLTFWYRTEERSIRVAFILASATLAGAFGGAVAYGVGHMNGTQGLSAWRWLFILEGIPSVLSAVPVYFFLPDYPETASWLSQEERELAIRRLAVEGSHGYGKSLTWKSAKETLCEWRLYAHYAVSSFSKKTKKKSLFTLAWLILI